MRTDPMSRRAILGAFLALAASRLPAAASDGILPAIRWAEKADAAYLASGRVAADLTAARLPMPAGWRAYRLALARVRMLARLDLYALTPGMPETAAALVAYHTSRAERSGDPGAMRAARRRIREVFARPCAVLPPRPT